MPLYDYQCDQCGHRFEVRQGIKEDPLTECPQCGGSIRRVLHPVGIVFKGSGFYITDSRKQSSATTGSSTGSGTGKKAESAASDTSGSSSTSDKSAAPAATAGEGSSGKNA